MNGWAIGAAGLAITSAELAITSAGLFLAFGITEDNMDATNLFIVFELAKAAHALEAQRDESSCVEAGHMFEAALRHLEDVEGDRNLPGQAFPTRSPLWLLGLGWHSSPDIFGALARVDGGGYFRFQACPHRLRTPLLAAFVEAAKENYHPWQEGVEELKRRNGLTWRLRDLGLWPMPKH